MVAFWKLYNFLQNGKDAVVAMSLAWPGKHQDCIFCELMSCTSLWTQTAVCVYVLLKAEPKQHKALAEPSPSQLSSYCTHSTW